MVYYWELKISKFQKNFPVVQGFISLDKYLLDRLQLEEHFYKLLQRFKTKYFIMPLA